MDLCLNLNFINHFWINLRDAKVNIVVIAFDYFFKTSIFLCFYLHAEGKDGVPLPKILSKKIFLQKLRNFLPRVRLESSFKYLIKHSGIMKKISDLLT